MSSDLETRIASAEQRLGRTLPADWKAALASPPAQLEPLVAPEDLSSLADAAWAGYYSGVPQGQRDLIIPFCPDGAGNYAAFFYDATVPQVIDLDHETGGDNYLDTRWESFSHWLKDQA